MAGIDHTCLYWIYGEPSDWEDVQAVLDKYGLTWSRDGYVYVKSKENIADSTTSYDPNSLVYRERYSLFKKLWSYDPPKFLSGIYFGTLRTLDKCLLWLSPAYKDYDRVYRSYKFKDAEVLIQTEHQGDLNISFVTVPGHAVVILGGYGHFINPYTHFMDRGYGDEFECKMQEEAYRWCMEQLVDVLFYLFYKDRKPDEFGRYEDYLGRHYADLRDLIKTSSDYKIFSGNWSEDLSIKDEEK